MYAHRLAERASAGSRTQAVLTWLGGGHWRELGESHERSTHAIAGVVVLVDAALAWLVATLAITGSTRWPIAAILPLTGLFGLLIGAVTRAIASGPTRGRLSIAGRGAVALAVAVVVGESAALVLLSGAIDRRLDEQAARNADSSPAVAQSSADLDQARRTRTALDDAVEQARAQRDEALVVARCEYNPSPACPQTQITGVPGAGPETRTANDLLADAQREFDNTLATRDDRAPELDSQIADRQRAFTQARETALAHADRSLGARWIAMQEYTFANAGALLLRLLAIAFFALLSLLPLILKLWRGETTHDRGAAARAERDRAETEADTAIAVKRAKVRTAAETMWAEQQLANARLAVAAQNEIDREQYRRRVVEALEGPVHSSPLPRPEPAVEHVYLPIAAEAEAASLAAAQSPAGEQGVDEPQNLPAHVESGTEQGFSRMPTIPGVTKAAARWIRPFVPPIVARAIETTAQPIRTARQVFEEVEEITFSLKRTRKVTVSSEESTEQRGFVATDTRATPQPAPAERASLGEAAADDTPFRLTKRENQPELSWPGDPGQLPGPDGPRQLPPGD